MDNLGNLEGYNGMDPQSMVSISAANLAASEKALAALPPAKSSLPAPAKYKKAPDAPKRFKSAFIIFSAEKHKSIKGELAEKGRVEKTTDIAKLVSEAWREMGAEEKEEWEKKARKDKARYEVEKAMYKGPWKIPANKRTPKDPTAPKRPMSAFLAFSNKRRAGLKRETPDATNADLSKMLSKTWKEAPEELRKKYMDEEAGLRATYKVEMAKWRKRVAQEKKQERDEREAAASATAEANQNAAANATQSNAAGMPPGQFAAPGVAPAAGGMGFPGQPQDMSGIAGAYGNPYAMQGMNGFGGVPNGATGTPADAAQYANMMSGGHPFSGQPFMAANNAQQQLLSQLFGQQFKQGQPGGPGNTLGMYSGLPGGPGMPGGQQNGAPANQQGGMPPQQRTGAAANPQGLPAAQQPGQAAGANHPGSNMGSFAMGNGMDGMPAQANQMPQGGFQNPATYPGGGFPGGGNFNMMNQAGAMNESNQQQPMQQQAPLGKKDESQNQQFRGSM